MTLQKSTSKPWAEEFSNWFNEFQHYEIEKLRRFLTNYEPGLFYDHLAKQFNSQSASTRPKTIHFMFFGNNQHGKSTFLNSLFLGLGKSQHYFEYFPIGWGEGFTLQKNGRYVSNNKTIVAWDTRGYRVIGEQELLHFQRILRGLKDDSKTAQMAENEEIQSCCDIENARVNIGVVCIAADASESEKQTVKRLVEKCRNNNIIVFVIITKTDLGKAVNVEQFARDIQVHTNYIDYSHSYLPNQAFVCNEEHNKHNLMLLTKILMYAEFNSNYYVPSTQHKMVTTIKRDLASLLQTPSNMLVAFLFMSLLGILSFNDPKIGFGCFILLILGYLAITFYNLKFGKKEL